MNNVFDIKRFCKYFVFELRSAKNNYGLSMLILGIMPIVLFAISELFSLIFAHHITELPMAAKYAQLAIVFLIASIVAGSKIYGHVTEKRAGSNYLMLPASTLEKWLSMTLIVCIVVPAILFVGQFLCDSIMSFIFPNTYGPRFFQLEPIQELAEKFVDNGIHFNVFGVVFWNWCETILTFTLGAICFKKSKIAKTLLCVIAGSILLSTLMMIIAGEDGSLYINWLEKHIHDADDFASLINWTANLSFFVFIGGFLGAMYYRLRTLKH